MSELVKKYAGASSGPKIPVQGMPFKVFVPDWDRNRASSTHEAAKALEASLLRLHSAVVLSSAAFAVAAWMSRDKENKDIAMDLVRPDSQRVFEKEAQKCMNELAGGFFTDTGQIFTADFKEQYRLSFKLRSFLAANPRDGQYDEGFAIAMEEVQRASYRYFVEMACAARNPYDLHRTLAFIDADPQVRLDYAQDPEAWRQRHAVSGRMEIRQKYLILPVQDRPSAGYDELAK